jgi:hypothetical protein
MYVADPIESMMTNEVSRTNEDMMKPPVKSAYVRATAYDPAYDPDNHGLLV